MKLKTFILLLFLPVVMFAAEPPAAQPEAKPDNPLIPKYYSFETLAAVKTTDFDNTTGYYGLGVQGYWSESVGFGFESLWREQQVREGDDGPVVDQTNLQLLLTRAYTPSLNYTIFAGGGREWLHDQWLVDAGIRLDQRLFKLGEAEVTLFGSARWEKELEEDSDHMGLFAVGFSLDF